jgi:hypothetical protein
MFDQRMNSTERASGILAAWERRDLPGLEAELALTQCDCGETGNASIEEQERMDLLGGIAGQMQKDLPQLPAAGDSAERSEVCFHLLRHLAASGKHPPIRSEKLSFFP